MADKQIFLASIPLDRVTNELVQEMYGSVEGFKRSYRMGNVAWIVEFDRTVPQEAFRGVKETKSLGEDIKLFARVLTDDPLIHIQENSKLRHPIIRPNH